MKRNPIVSKRETSPKQQIETRLFIKAPRKFTVSLVSAEDLATSRLFRNFFEFYSAVTTVLIGAIISAPMNKLLWVFVLLTAVSAIVFWRKSVGFERRARLGDRRSPSRRTRPKNERFPGRRSLSDNRPKWRKAFQPKQKLPRLFPAIRRPAKKLAASR